MNSIHQERVLQNAQQPQQQTQQEPPIIDLLSGGGGGDNHHASTTANNIHSDTNYVSMEIAQIPSMHSNNNNNNNDDDDDAEERSIAKSIVSSVLTADGIHDVPGFVCVCLVILIGDMSRGVMFPSMWPLVETLGGNQVLLGYAVAAFSFGRVIMNPVFGSWSHSIGYSKTLLISCSLLLLGTLAYAQITNIGRPEFLIVAQTLLGIGSGTLGVTRAFVADVTAKRNRTTYMAWMTAVQYGGFTVTPLFGALFNKIFGPEVGTGLIHLDMFTAPAYFMSAIVLSTIGALLLFFRDRVRIDTVKEGKKSMRRMAIEDVAQSTTIIGLTVYDCCILGCMLLNIATKGSIASFETIGIAVAQSHFDMLTSRAGLVVGCCGVVGVIALLNMGFFTSHFTDVQLIVGGCFVMIMGITLLATIHEEVVNPAWKYVVAMFMIYAIGYPIGHTAVIGLFSKIVGRRPQGTLLGWFASAGSLARMIFPICSGYIVWYRNVETLFLILMGVLTTASFFVLVSRQTLNLLSS